MDRPRRPSSTKKKRGRVPAPGDSDAVAGSESAMTTSVCVFP